MISPTGDSQRAGPTNVVLHEVDSGLISSLDWISLLLGKPEASPVFPFLTEKFQILCHERQAPSHPTAVSVSGMATTIVYSKDFEHLLTRTQRAEKEVAC